MIAEGIGLDHVDAVVARRCLQNEAPRHIKATAESKPCNFEDDCLAIEMKLRNQSKINQLIVNRIGWPVAGILQRLVDQPVKGAGDSLRCLGR